MDRVELFFLPRWVQAEARAALASVSTEGKQLAVTWPWEDVFFGAALAHAVPRSDGAGLAAVHAGSSVYIEEWGFWLAPATLIWHQKTKVPRRIVRAAEWAATRHCALPGARLEVYYRNYTSCAGATWLCAEMVYAPGGGNCSQKRVNLLLAPTNRSAAPSTAARRRPRPPRHRHAHGRTVVGDHQPK